MSVAETSDPSRWNRREVLRASAGAGVLGLTTLSHAAKASADDAFLVKPYLQLGDAPQSVVLEPGVDAVCGE